MFGKHIFRTNEGKGVASTDVVYMHGNNALLIHKRLKLAIAIFFLVYYVDDGCSLIITSEPL